MTANIPTVNFIFFIENHELNEGPLRPSKIGETCVIEISIPRKKIKKAPMIQRDNALNTSGAVHDPFSTKRYNFFPR
jgi:hypothetical protein